jgi:hypothetical protein
VSSAGSRVSVSHTSVDNATKSATVLVALAKIATAKELIQ